MWRTKLVGLGLGILSLTAVTTLQAETTTTVVEKTIVSPAPQATCKTVPAHWDNNVWVTGHDVCQYENRPEGVAWVADYWSCTQAASDGSCSKWELVPGHWVKTLE